MNRTIALTAICLVALPTCGRAQESDFPAEPSIYKPILYGAGLGIVGFVGGGALGSALDTGCDNTSDFCIEAGLALGAALAGTAGVSIGSHLGNRRRGTFWKVSAFSLLTWAAGIGSALALSAVSDDAAYAMMITLPAIQLGVTVLVERKTGRDNEGRQRGLARLIVFAAPDSRGVRLGARFKL